MFNTILAEALSHARRLWCRMAHEQFSWPIHGRYRCLVCHREYDVPWARIMTTAQR
jgi:hypothetical protein